MAKEFKQVVNLVELTKLLERETCDTLVVSKYLGNPVYPDRSTILQNKVTYKSDNWYDDDTITFSMMYLSNLYINTTVGIVPIYSTSDPNGVSYKFVSFGYLDNKLSKVSIKAPNGEITDIPVKYGEKNQTVYFELNQVGTYEITYEIVAGRQTQEQKYYKNFAYFIEVLPMTSVVRPQPTITSVLERLLGVYTARKVGSPVKYRLDPAIAEKYRNTPSPEFAFTRCTLFEALRQVGGYIHGFPRLRWDKETDEPSLVTYDIFGTMGEWKPAHPIRDIGKAVTWDSGDYCGELDSYVDNFINTKDQAAGVLTEPWDDFYKTMRTEQTQVRISNDNVLLETEFPIYRLIRLETGYLSDGTVVGDITKFVYESAEYQNLSKYTDNYPNSVAYALQYSQGGRTISGFQAKELEKPIFEALQKPTIENIVNKLGISFPDGLAYKDLAFRITYIPIVAARVKQRKLSVNAPQSESNTLFYNQAANLAENNYYGQNMRGAIARMGNKTLVKTYVFAHFEDMPKIGMKCTIDGEPYVVSRINKEWERYYIKATVFFTPEYNMLSQFVGINSNYRLYDVSERQSFDRNINVSEDILIGDPVGAKGLTSLNPGAVAAYLKLLCGTDSAAVPNGRTTCALIETKTAGGVTIAKVVKAAASFACGNSIVFSWKMPDNFTAGARSVYYDASQNVQQLVQYGNVYGEFENMRVAFYDRLLNRAPTFADQKSTAADAAAEDLLPQFDGVPDGGNAAEFELVVKKDSREAIGLTYQAHSKVTRDTIVLGRLFTENSPLIKDAEKTKSPVVAFFPEPLDKLQGNAYVETVKTALRPQGGAEGKKITIAPIRNATGRTFSAWGLVDPDTEELYLGENLDLPPEGETKPIVINF